MAEATPSERVLVTGATGFLATHIIKQLLEAKYQVRGTVRDPENEEKCKHLKDLVPDTTVEVVKADLLNEEGWKSAVEGCTYVIHTANPFPMFPPSNPDDVVKPAVEGIKNIFGACKEAGGVKRVVLTSAGLSVIGTLKGGEFSEKDWPENPENLDPYPKSKTLAEKAAWDFVKELKDEEKFELAVVNPVMLLGPVLHNTMGTSMELMKRLLEKNPPIVPKLNLPAIDVRDAAKAHIVAMTTPEAADNRHILCTDNIWWSEMTKCLSEEFKPQGYKIASMNCPKIGLTMASFWNKDAKAVLPNWNKVSKLDNTRMKEVLKITEPVDLKTSIIDMAYSLIEGGFVKKTPKYKGRNWRDILEQEKAEREAAKEAEKAKKEAEKAEKEAAKKAAKAPKVNGDAGAKENGDVGKDAAEGEDKTEEGDDKTKEGEEEKKEEEGGEKTEEGGAKKEEQEESKEEAEPKDDEEKKEEAKAEEETSEEPVTEEKKDDEKPAEPEKSEENSPPAEAGNAEEAEEVAETKEEAALVENGPVDEPASENTEDEGKSADTEAVTENGPTENGDS